MALAFPLPHPEVLEVFFGRSGGGHLQPRQGQGTPEALGELIKALINAPAADVGAQGRASRALPSALPP